MIFCYSVKIDGLLGKNNFRINAAPTGYLFRRNRMKNWKINVIVLLFVFFSLISCIEVNNERNEWDYDPSVAVYTAGFIGYGSNVETVLWENGTEHKLGPGSGGSLYVSGNDIYVAGTSGSKATLWKNGAAETLDNNSSYASSVFVSGDDVYVAGGISGKATLWINGAALTLSTDDSSASSVFVSGNDVYVAGIIYSNYKAVLWKNGTQQILSNNAYARSVYVSGNDVYVAGTTNNGTSATLWKNGTEQALSDQYSYSYSVCVSGNDVYVAGSISGKATLWKNGTAQTLSDGSAYSVYVFGNDVYAAGAGGNKAILWKNGIVKLLSNQKSEARTVFVVPRN